MKHNIIKTFMVLMVLALASGCSPISNHMDQLKLVEERVKNGHYDQRNTSFINEIKSKSSAEAYKALVTDENLAPFKAELTKASKDIEAAAVKLRAIDDESYNDANINKGNRAADSLRQSVQRLSIKQRDIEKRFERLASMIDKRPEQAKAINDSYATFDKAKAALYEQIVDASTRHPRQKARLGEFVANLDAFDKEYQYLSGFFKRSPGGLTFDDYNEFVDRYRKANIEKSFPLSLVQDYKRMLEQLDLSYSKILVGMSESHSVLMGSVSWDNYYDYPTEHTQRYQYVEVTYPQKQQIMSNFGSGRTYSTSSLERSNLLSLATNGQNKRSGHFPSGDDEAEVWVEDSESIYSHEYIVVIDGKATEVEEEVSRQFYLKHKNDEGKEIFSKPYGYFEDEAFDAAVKPGESFVGNPAYGQWVRDPNTGMDAWQWIAAYIILDDLLDGDRYDRSYYNKRRDYYSTYVPPYSRSSGRLTNSWGVISDKSPMSQGVVAGRKGQTLGATGSSLRNRGPGNGK